MQDNKISKETKEGLFLAFFSFTFWGLTPIFFKLLQNVDAGEILFHRIFWSVIFLWIILSLKKDFSNLKLNLTNSKVKKQLLASGAIISANWLTYIWAITHNQILEVSLGYFINPLMSIMLGIFILKEKASFVEKVAIGIVALAVIYQIYMLGNLPMVSVILATSFPIYGLLRKQTNINSLQGLYVETKLMLPFGLLYFLYLVYAGENHFDGSFEMVNFLLFLAGLVTVIPLLTFSVAAKRLKYSTIGYFQYIGPSINLILAIFLYNEKLSYEKFITFSLIWFALFLVTYDNYNRRRKK